MKKIIYIFLFLLIMTGCSRENKTKDINTIIEQDKNMLVAINYPITNIKKLDKIIKNDIENIYNNFKQNYTNFNNLDEQSELNIDYKYDKIDNYINITIKTFINSSMLAHPLNYIKTYVYDQSKNKLINLDDILDNQNKIKFTDYIKKELINKYKNCLLLDEFKATVTNKYDYPLFSFNNKYLTIYFNPADITASYCNIINVSMSIDKLNINLNKENKMVNSQIEIPIRVINPNKKVIALTFDDGPSKYTKEILEVLKENDAYATFFVIGNKVDIFNETIKKTLAYGNEIGNHSYNHMSLTKLSDIELHNQIDKTQEIIKKVTGHYPTSLRPTYGAINDKIRKKIDLDIILWNIDTRDWKYKSINSIVKRALKAKDLDIILMHDTKKRTVEALKKIIPELKKQGFEFVTISELKEIKTLRKKNHNDKYPD